MNPSTSYTPSEISGSNAPTIQLSDIFNASNPTTKSVSVRFMSELMNLGSMNSSASNANSFSSLSDTYWGTLGTLTLNAPPTYTSATLTTSGQAYKKAYTVTVTVAGVSAKYGGTISSIKLQIGNQSTTRTTNGTLSITVNQTGTFTPTLTITDSRGQVTTKTFNAITVADNTCDLTSLSTQRVNASTGVQQDDGTNAVVAIQTTYTSALTTNALNQPTLTINGTAATVTWYESWDPTIGFSSPIAWSSYRPSSPATIYGWVSDTLSTQSTYEISAQISTPYATSTAITANLATAFYLLSGRAGGRGLGIGMKAPGDNLYIGMDEYLFDDTGNIVSALATFGWSSAYTGTLANLQTILEKILERLSLFDAPLVTGANWSSGALTVPGSAKYRAFELVQAGASVVAFRYGNSIRGFALSGNATSGNYNQYIRAFGASVNWSTEVWTLEWAKQLSHVTSSGYHTSGTTQSITEIRGLIPLQNA